jgi:hypothetical protein
MPRRTARTRKGGARRMRGRGVMDVLKKIHGFVKKHKVISRGSSALAGVLPEKYGKWVGRVGNAAGAFGYGRRRGGALMLSGARRGGALRLA